MSSYLDKPVAYLEIQDFNQKGELIGEGIPKDIPIVIMVQASWCKLCTSAKPEFQAFADATKGHVFCATIQVDGERKAEKELGKQIKVLKPTLRGFPDYLLYKDGKRIDREIEGRGVRHLRDFSML